MARTPTAQLSAPDQARRHGLHRMKAIALGALLFLACVFVIAFVFEQRAPWLVYVRAAAEGGMVGALADWFAVTALFRHPLGLPIPHTAIIPTRKDEIGRTLGTFVEENFLSADIVRAKLGQAGVARRLGSWLARSENAERIGDEGAAMASAVLRALSDADVQHVLEALAREHLLAPPWAPTAGEWLARVVDADAHRDAVDLAIDSIATWLAANERAFDGLVSRRLPAWVPGVAQRLVDEAVYHEAVKFALAVKADPRHPARHAVDGYLARLAQRLQHDPAMIDRFEAAKAAVFDDPRVRLLAARLWQTAKSGLLTALADPRSALRVRARDVLTEVGGRLTSDAALQARVDGWTTDAAAFLVDHYRHDIASIITDTVERWDAGETTEKLELLVGRDLQYIRLNGTIVGALAGAAIFAVAQALLG